jgi:hypothetical protein
MQPEATIANVLWTASNLPSYLQIRRALQKPGLTQHRKLLAFIRENADTEFGKAHKFDTIHSYEDYKNRVSVSDYVDFEPYITRIREGVPRVLTAAPVTHLVPTSGSTGWRKLIPFTSGLQREFNAAIGPWLMDLAIQFPGIIGGPAYWSISPVLSHNEAEQSAVPIGFDADTAYLGGNRRRLAEAVMAVPRSVSRAKSLEHFHYTTLLHLLRCRDLRLISVWHPSFLTLLLDNLPRYWEELLSDIEEGIGSGAGLVGRARELRLANPSRPETLWPSLRVLSCWGSAAAAVSLEDIRQRFPMTCLQPKGLVATEAFVTLPLYQQYPLAVNSHFFEFLDNHGKTYAVEDICVGNEYEVIVTNGGGLWRYRFGDRVRVTGRVQNTPTLEFLGRGESTSDRFGEKLSDAFVAEVLQELFRQKKPGFALLAPDDYKEGCRYTLYIDGEIQPDWPKALDHALCRNPHYAYCREIGQLLPAALFRIERNAFDAFARRHLIQGTRLGNIKPVNLVRSNGWSNVFRGAYVHEHID